MWLRCLMLLTALVVSAQSLVAQEGLRVDLNIPELKLTVFEGDSLLRTYPVAVGMVGHNTPMGSFKISRAEWNPWWRPPEREWAEGEKVTPPGPNNPMGRVKLFFLPYYFLHGTPDSESIGTPASHGCVRMRNADVIALARLIHSRVAPQVTSAEIDRILSRSGTTRTVGFRDSVELVIRYDPVVVREGSVHVFPDIYNYKAIHGEAFYQALIAGGYDVTAVKREDVQKLITRGKAARTAFSVPVAEAFGATVAGSVQRTGRTE